MCITITNIVIAVALASASQFIDRSKFIIDR